MMRLPYKITVIGAGAVGATLAHRILEGDIADVIMIDIMGDMARGKAYDLSDAAPIKDHERKITGTDDYALMKGSHIVVITAGFARKPGMSREDLIAKNAAIVKGVAEQVRTHAPDALVIVVTNPLDVMTYLTCQTTGFDRKRVFGMAGVLDGSRFTQLVSEELGVPRSEIETCILGSHGDTMVPVISRTTVQGKPITEAMSPEILDRIVQRTRDRGAEIVKLFGTGSAFYSPSAGVLKLIECIVDNAHETLAVSVCLDGEYGLHNIAMGVPCTIGKSGVEEIIEFDLDKQEKESFQRSAQAIKKAIDRL